MERLDEHLTPREAVLVLIDAAGGALDGRTALQKLAYFGALALDEDLGHTPYYYGPFSRDIEQAVADAGLADELVETVNQFPASHRRGPDIKQYRYELTEDGHRSVQEIRQRAPRAAERIDRAVAEIREAVPELDQQVLSRAAKIHLILSRQDSEIEADEIPALARELGWELDEEEVRTTVELMERLHLVEVGA
ncbi:MAG TPA: hypothetical protein VFR97_10530 [Capillimicrobium sp.]|nr:hypothetical protein [Capillimicrobium sp.]